jgi:transposase
MALSAQEILVVGIDPAKEKHSIVALKYPDVVLHAMDIPNTAPAIAKLDSRMLRLAGEERLSLVYATEDSSKYGSLLAGMLRQSGRLIQTVNPGQTKHFKRVYGDNKTDRIDARCVAAIVLHQPEKIEQREEVTRRSDLQESMKSVTGFFNDLTKANVKFVNHLHEKLFDLWGCQYKEFFGRINGKTALKFWKSYPSPRSVKDISSKELQGFIYKESRHSISNDKAKKIGIRVLQVASEFPGILGEKTLDLKEKDLQQLADMLAVIEAQLKGSKATIKNLVKESDCTLRSFPGIDYIRAAALMGLVGNPARFANKDKFAKYNGTAPREWSSGRSKKHYASKQYNRKLKTLLMGITITAVRCDKTSKEYYQRQIQRGKTKRQAYKLTARRISDILFSMMRNHTEYDNERHKKTEVEMRNKKNAPKISNDGAGQKAQHSAA